MTVFIGGAWPYANGSLHLGRVTSILPGDILARYFRQKGEDVLYVSGSDCHGTPISILASQEGVPPQVIADRYHQEFVDCFQKLGFSYDLYTRTDHPHHHKVVQNIFRTLLENDHIYPQSVEQTYCTTCDRFLPDRYVEGNCPHCGQIARGDQCDHCSALLDPLQLLDRKCKVCLNHPTTRFTEHFFLALSKFQTSLENYVEQNSTKWRKNAVELTRRYLREGLHDRAATRDLTWGIDVPMEGFEEKKIYVWIEAVSGYLSASIKWAEDNNADWKKFWSADTTAYYVHGKDNIPFHTIILPAILMGIGDLHLPDKVISSEYLTLEGKKFSTSRNWAVWVPYLLEHYHPDSIRYFLTINGPENRDTDFSWREFILSHNGELLGAFGNFVNRSLVFVNKSLSGKVPQSVIDPSIAHRLQELYIEIGDLIEHGRLKDSLETIFRFIRNANKYFDERKPWNQIHENIANCEETLYTCVQIIANLSNLLEPFIPFSCQKTRSFLGMELPTWAYTEITPGQKIQPIEVLFERIDTRRIQEEANRLGD